VRRLVHLQNECARVSVPDQVSKLFEANLKALSVTNCFPVQAPLLLSFPETSRCSDPAAAAQEGSESQLTVL